LIERKTSRTISRKIRGSRKPRASRKVKQRKTTDDKAMQQGCTAVHPRQRPAIASRPRRMAVPRHTVTRVPDAWTCVVAWATVHGGN